MSSETPITRENLNEYLKELAQEFRKLKRKLNGSKMSCTGRSCAEVILIGGAAILANYGFREMTYDIDAIYNTSSKAGRAWASSAMKDAINPSETGTGFRTAGSTRILSAPGRTPTSCTRFRYITRRSQTSCKCGRSPGSILSR
jgi:hypothetical protein